MSDPITPVELSRLCDAEPTRGANPAGDTARATLVHRIKRGTPGSYSSRPSSGILPFREIFFPAVHATADDARIDASTGLGPEFFAEFAVLCLTDQMVVCTRDLSSRLLSTDITAGLREHNRTLRARVSAWYTLMVTETVGPVRTALAPFGTDAARREARARYIAELTGPAWINLKNSQRELGQWPEREWELFHHWIKLMALGTPGDEIDQAITAVRSGGLDIPPVVGPGAWREWAPWWAADIGASDADDATNPILATTYHALPRGAPAAITEGYSLTFTSSGQPGHRYRQPPASSCFAPGTKVVLADGELRDIELIGPGELVHTPYGPRAVLFRSAPRRGGRTLVHFDGPAGGFAFAASHPFVVRGDAGQPDYAAADPLELARIVPTLAQFGICPLASAEPTPLSRYTPDGDKPFLAGAVRPDPNSRPTHLHDLFLEVGPDGRSEFYAGDEQVQLLVSSEAPRFAAAPRAAEVVLGVLNAVTPTILDALDRVSDEDFADILIIGLDALARELLATIGPALPLGATAMPARSAAELAAAVDAVAQAANGHDSRTSQRIGTLIERFVATFARSFEAVIALGWRIFPKAPSDLGTVLAVTVYDLELIARRGRVPAAGATVRLDLRRGAASQPGRLPVRGAPAGDRSCYTVDNVSYFPQWRPIGETRQPGWQLRIRIDGDPATARLRLPDRIDPAFMALTGLLADPDGNPVGIVSLDLRALRVEDLVAEAKARPAWRPGDEPAVASALAALAAAHINDRFAELVAQLRPLAVTGPGSADGKHRGVPGDRG